MARVARRDRYEVFLEYTKSVCPLCKVVVDAEVLVRDNRYLSNRVTPDRGVREALERMFSSSAMPGAERALLECETCGIDLPGALRELEMLQSASSWRWCRTSRTRTRSMCAS